MWSWGGALRGPVPLLQRCIRGASPAWCCASGPLSSGAFPSATPLPSASLHGWRRGVTMSRRVEHHRRGVTARSAARSFLAVVLGVASWRGATGQFCNIAPGGHVLDLSNAGGHHLATTAVLDEYTPCNTQAVFPCNTWELCVTPPRLPATAQDDSYSPPLTLPCIHHEDLWSARRAAAPRRTHILHSDLTSVLHTGKACSFVLLASITCGAAHLQWR